MARKTAANRCCGRVTERRRSHTFQESKNTVIFGWHNVSILSLQTPICPRRTDADIHFLPRGNYFTGIAHNVAHARAMLQAALAS
jgi:hypothetical protein